MPSEQQHGRTEAEETMDRERKADQETERREDEGWSQPESSAQKAPQPPGPEA